MSEKEKSDSKEIKLPEPSVELLVNGIEFTKEEMGEIEQFLAELLAKKTGIDKAKAVDSVGASSVACLL